MNKDITPKFQTHIKEPRWQQIISVVVVGVALGLWLTLAIVR